MICEAGAQIKTSSSNHLACLHWVAYSIHCWPCLLPLQPCTVKMYDLWQMQASQRHPGLPGLAHAHTCLCAMKHLPSLSWPRLLMQGPCSLPVASLVLWGIRNCSWCFYCMCHPCC